MADATKAVSDAGKTAVNAGKGIVGTAWKVVSAPVKLAAKHPIATTVIVSGLAFTGIVAAAGIASTTGATGAVASTLPFNTASGITTSAAAANAAPTAIIADTATTLAGHIGNGAYVVGQNIYGWATGQATALASSGAAAFPGVPAPPVPPAESILTHRLG